MRIYALVYLKNGDDFTYFRIDINISSTNIPSFAGRDFNYRFIKGNRDFFINIVDIAKNRIFDYYCWAYQELYHDNCMYSHFSSEDDLLDNFRNVDGFFGTLVSSEYFSKDVKSKFKVVKSLTDEFMYRYLLEKEIM